MKIFLSLVIFLSLAGCISPKQNQNIEDIYSANQECNGEITVNHSIILGGDGSGKANEPDITAECVPQMYDPQSDFEKENRRKTH